MHAHRPDPRDEVRRSLEERPRNRHVALWLAGSVIVILPALLILGAVGTSRTITGPAGSTPRAEATAKVAASADVAAALQPSSSNPPSSGAAGTSSPPAGGSPSNVYAATGVGMFSPLVVADPARVYVPDERSGTVSVIDPRTFRVVARYAVGASPEHITPGWDLRFLYVETTYAGRLAVIDPATGRLIGHRKVQAPYNLYFSLDGRWAIDVVDRRVARAEYPGTAQLYIYDRRTWRLRKALNVPWPGANHLDFSADGRYLILSTEYAGFLVKIDTARWRIVTALFVGGSPTDVRLSPDGTVFYVANQGRNGVSVVDPATMREVAFIRTGHGAHGLAISRDARSLYVTNRLAGSLSVIDFTTRRIVATWRIGGSPDMIAVSPDGTQLWISNRFNGSISVVDTRTGHIVRRIRTGGRPHGLAFFPEPGRLSLGHNGNFR